MRLKKSKAGFTLVELLIVVAILAVVAAIAIPSVAGLINRANVSADNANADEMTNAIERFVSEYELTKQDIYSGTFMLTNLNATQNRVRNAVGLEGRQDIYNLETHEYNTDAYALNRNTKYPMNEKTVKKVIAIYTNTDVSSFAPKQSDCSYYYSPELGRIVVAETGVTKSELMGIAFSEHENARLTEWIDLSVNADVPEGDWTGEIYVTEVEGSYAAIDDVVENRPVTPQTCKHTNSSIKGASAATCAATGYSGDKVCDDCNTILKNGSRIPKTGHEIVTVGKKETTCAAPGYTGDRQCTICGTVTNTGSVIPQLEHELVTVDVVNATCISDGYTGDEKCIICQEIIQAGEVIYAVGHVNTERLSETHATCTADGYTGDLYCNDCHTVIVEGEIIYALGHIESYWYEYDEYEHVISCERADSDCYGEILYSEPHNIELDYEYYGSCMEESYREYYCYDCGYYKVETLGYEPCSYEIIDWYAGDCIIEEYEYYECMNCGEGFYEYYGYGDCSYELYDSYGGDCMTEAYDYYECIICGDSFYEYYGYGPCYFEGDVCLHCGYCCICGEFGCEPYYCYNTCYYCGETYCYGDCLICDVCGCEGCDDDYCYNTCDMCGTVWCCGECMETCPYYCGVYGCYGECMETCPYYCGNYGCYGECMDYWW